MPDATVSIMQADELTGDIEVALGALLPQLSSRAELSASTIRTVIESDATTLLIARSDGEIVGALTLVTFTIPTGCRAWIEDVVVDGAARGKGVGQALVEAAVALARTKGASTVDLTSRPERAEANRLYQRCGFEQRVTNVYRIELRDSERSEVSYFSQ